MNKKFEALLYSTVGLVVVLAIVVLINIIAGGFKTRLDMTADKVFTLADGTKAILKKLDSPVEVRFYYSRGEKNIPPEVPTFAQNVEDLLTEFAQNSGGKLTIKKFDPQPDSDAEDLARNDGIEPQTLQTGDEYYLGLAISMDPQKVAVPLLPGRDRQLEYDIARAISRVMTTTKPVVGVMTPLPMFGAAPNPMMMRMGQQQQQQRPWIAITELKNDFDVKPVPMDTDKIDDDIQVLIVAQPRGITDKAQFALDQFVLRGGKLLALLDGMSMMDHPQSDNPMLGQMPGGGSTLDRLLKAWGVTFDNTRVVADLTYSRELQFQEGGRPQATPTWLFLTKEAVNQDDIVTSEIDNLLLPAAGAFGGTPANGLKQTVLLKSSKRSQLVEGMTAQYNGQKIVDDFHESGAESPLAIRLQGKFKSAFPDGKPDEDKGTNTTAKTGYLTESARESAVVLIGDSDFIYDNFCARVIPMFNIAQPINGNLGLLQNIVEQLAGDSNLIGTRSRATVRRPFTVVKEKEMEAQKKYQAEVTKLQTGLEETQRQLNELQGKKEAGQRFILSKEQQQKIQEFRTKEANAKKELKNVRKELRAEIDSLETRLKFLNIFGMAGVVVVAGLAVFVIRSQRTQA